MNEDGKDEQELISSIDKGILGGRNGTQKFPGKKGAFKELKFGQFDGMKRRLVHHDATGLDSNKIWSLMLREVIY